MLIDPSLERWKQFWEVANGDSKWTQFHAKEDEQRKQVREEMLCLLQAFFANEITVDQFRATFDSRTRTKWDVFGLKGMSGAMFLNKLVKYISDKELLTKRLRAILTVPADEAAAKEALGEFYGFLKGVIDGGHATKAQLQPARATFFVSAWWHMQDPTAWPIYYVSGKRTLESEGLIKTTGDAVADYFAFREAFNYVAASLKLSPWSCEHLLDWCHQQSRDDQDDDEDDAPLPPVMEDNGDEPADGIDEVTHTQVQWLLAKIGHRLGCSVWIAANDHSKSWNGQQLGDLSVDALPNLGLDASSQKIIGLIDVVWLKGAKQIAAAFEVEHSTSVYSGLLRMSDLVVLAPNLNFPLYLVAPKSRIKKVRRELSRPTFQALELHKRCAFFTDESLVREADVMMKWATDPSAIEKIASTVDDVNES